MASFNNCTFSGNLGKDPELRYFEDGKMVANFTIAVEGRRGSGAMWIPVKVWGKQAQVIGDYVKKGSQIIVNGELQQETWNKGDEKMSRMVLNCNTFTLLGRKDKDGAGAKGGAPKATQRPENRQSNQPAPEHLEEEDDIPF